jgi:hypothetical protein
VTRELSSSSSNDSSLTWRQQEDEDFDLQIPADFDAIPIRANETRSHLQPHERERGGFDTQAIAVDFDAVPLVTATILEQEPIVVTTTLPVDQE